MTIRKFLSRLRGDKGGNAMLLVAMGAPALFGTTGYAVDTAQWYMWKRELQYAADQAALAGAWARGNGDTATLYYTRARQEFSANISIVGNYTTLDEATLEAYNGEANKAVRVNASTTGTLPFANFILGGSTTVSVEAKATYEPVQQYTACLLALNESAARALWFNGGPQVEAACGVGAISDADNAVSVSGTSGDFDIGWAVSGGGIDVGDNFGDADLVENLQDIEDPYKDLDAPTPAGNQARTLSCNGTPAYYSATKSSSSSTSYSYAKKVGNGNNATYQAYNSFQYAKSATSSSSSETISSSTSPTGSTSTSSTEWVKAENGGSGRDTIYEKSTTTTTVSYSNIVYHPAEGNTAQPGTYTSFSPSCEMTMAGGIYVIDGGVLNLNGNNVLTGNGVMFVLKNGASISINGNAAINLTPMTTTEELIAAGVDASEADGFVEMLIFEDRESSGTQNSQINGTATTSLNGTIYLPKSSMTLSGNMQATSSCLRIASDTLKVSGSAVIQNMCPPTDVDDVIVAGGGTKVRLIA